MRAEKMNLCLTSFFKKKNAKVKDY